MRKRVCKLLVCQKNKSVVLPKCQVQIQVSISMKQRTQLKFVQVPTKYYRKPRSYKKRIQAIPQVLKKWGPYRWAKWREVKQILSQECHKFRSMFFLVMGQSMRPITRQVIPLHFTSKCISVQSRLGALKSIAKIVFKE